MKPKTKTLLFILLSFLLGSTAGYVAFDAGLFRGGKVGRSTPQEFRREFHRKLSLDSLQIREVDSLLDSYWARMSIHRDAMIRDRDTLRSELRRRLSPEQQAAYDALNRQRDAKYERARRDTAR